MKVNLPASVSRGAGVKGSVAMISSKDYREEKRRAAKYHTEAVPVTFKQLHDNEKHKQMVT
jgi:hypothetical protein